MAVVRVITAYHTEVVEVQWTLRDGSLHHERYRVPPAAVVHARRQGVDPCLRTELLNPRPSAGNYSR